ncbi:hypothetical protein K490DRAFT_71351 [Saccharata proteae CBS 121410]|uniref:NIMA interactive protein n=1 Tax=Saccharata proteae CBS 121410 TaxID=1314787 RepID=A0A9P4LZ88_9PEZI|nr:hypothetical protein K490DRAFT_71351 [Saccharata proteae CBS 121410]
MAESYNLKSASAYINNLLLARGLLRNGKSIEFAHPSRGEGGKEATMAQIINLVHDLILRRDVDYSLTETLRNVRTESSRATLALERLQTRNDDLSRQVSLAQSSERSAKNALRAAESSARSLREEMLRLKTTVNQVRTACANDVRKRDLQIQKLKSHLTAQQRGNKTGLVGASITITPGQTGAGSSSLSRDDDGPDLDSAGYSLRQETTEFLTQLSQSLSDENDNLIGLVRSTLVTLRELQGLPETVQMAADAGMEAPMEEDSEANMMQALPTSYEALATDMDNVLENLRTLLTNPNFVPMDEVELREEEIMRLREGWVKMESRWKEAVAMMQGWRKRMMNGDTVTLEDLKLGFGSGEGLGPGSNGVEDYDAEEQFSGLEDVEEVSEPEASDIDEDPDLPSPEKPVPEEKQTDMFNIKLKPDQPVLKEADGNIRSPRKVAFPGHPDTPSQVADENASEVDIIPASTSKASVERNSRMGRSAEPPRQASGGISFTLHHFPSPSKPAPTLSVHGRSDSPRKLADNFGRKRRSSPLPHADEPSPKMTVQEKLGVARSEAEVVSISASLQAAETDGTKGEQVKGSPRKTKVRGKARRRKSTLSPEELEALMGLHDE